MSETARRIIITGFMAAGKTTIATVLARRLACRMIDLDFIINERERRNAQMIIDEDGEVSFRQAETEALRVLLENNTARVIALGGGAWTIERNRALVAEHDCLTIWLDAPFDLCWQRILSAGDTRPLARDKDAARELYDTRRALYQLAGLRLQASAEKSAEEVAAEIERWVASTQDGEK
jgi:shikimate kinase